MNKIIYLLSLAIVLHAPVYAAGAREASVPQDIDVTFGHSVAGDKLKVEYLVVNRSKVPVYLFDVMSNRGADGLNTNWVYADIDGGTAMLKRAMAPMPKDEFVEFPHVPYARELAPGARASGSFSIVLPLKQSEPYGPRDEKFQTVEVAELEVAIGWSPKAAMQAQLPGTKPVKIGGVECWRFDYYYIGLAQKIAKSAPAVVKLRARGFVPR